MPALTTVDLRRVLDLVYALNGDSDGPAGGPSGAVLADIGRLVGRKLGVTGRTTLIALLNRPAPPPG